MSNRTPISIKATYTNSNGELIETIFDSLSQASNFFSITPQSLKELSLGGTPNLPEKTPKDLKVVRITTAPKFPKTNSEKWHCDICDKDIKNKSKYAHIITMGHKKRESSGLNQ